MPKWLRERFAWRFSLIRLVVAVVFLGALVGLNMCKVGPTNCNKLSHDGYYYSYTAYQWGWPLPFTEEECIDEAVSTWDVLWTHQTYHLLTIGPWIRTETRDIYCGLIDVGFGITVVALILFFQDGRRRPEGAK